MSRAWFFLTFSLNNLKNVFLTFFWHSGLRKYDFLILKKILHFWFLCKSCVLGIRYQTLRDFLHMNFFFLKMSSPNRLLMVPPIVLDLPSVVWVSTNVFWYYNDDLGLVGMSICPKKVFESVYTHFLCNSCVNPVWSPLGKYTGKLIFRKNPKNVI